MATKLDGTEPEGVQWLGAVERPRWLSLVAAADAFLSAARSRGLRHGPDGGAGRRYAAGVRAGAGGTRRFHWRASWHRPGRAGARRRCAGPGAAALALAGPERAHYARRARGLLEPYSDEAGRRVAEELLPRLASPA